MLMGARHESEPAHETPLWSRLANVRERLGILHTSWNGLVAHAADVQCAWNSRRCIVNVSSKTLMKSSLLAALILAPGALRWEEKAKMPLPRAGYMAGAVSKRLLLAGGSHWANGKKLWSNRADFFDP